MYLQVDVPMERLPVANWLLIAFTALFSFKVFADEAKAHRQLLQLPQPDPAVEQKLRDPRLSPKQKQAIRAKEEERLEKLLTFDPSPTDYYALHTERDEFRAWQLLTHLFVHG